MTPPPPPGMVALPTPAPAPPVATVASPATLPVRESRLRNFFAALFAVLATALIATSVLLGWIDRTVLPTESFVRTGGPALTDPAIAGPLQAQLTAEVLAQLTPLVAGTSTTSTLDFDANAFNATVSQAAAVVVASPVARTSWDAALTTTHTRSVELARGAAPVQGEIVGTTLSVDLVPLALATRDQVALAGYPSVAGAEFPVTPFVITATSSAAQANEIVRIVDRWAWPAFALGLLAAAIAYLLSTRKGRLTLLLGADLLVAAAVLWVTAQLVGNVAGERGLTPQDQDALAALYAPFGNSLQQNAVFTALVGGVFIVAAVIVLSVQAQSDRRVRSSRPAPGR